MMWYQFDKETIVRLENKLIERNGVYCLRVLKNKSKNIALHINRAGRVDKKGILYYGNTNNLFERLKDCVGRFNRKKSYQHSGAKTYDIYFSKLGWFKDGSIQFSFKYCKDKRSAKKLESKLIARYRKKFLDKPPLNTI